MVKRIRDNEAMDVQGGKKAKVGHGGKDKRGRQVPITERLSVKEIAYLTEIKELKETIPCWDNMFSHEVDEEDRAQAWMRLEILGEPLIKKYSWAIPDEKALKIVAEFGPIIELGAGLGYWAWLLQQRGVDIIAFDKYTSKDKGAWTDVRKGDPAVLGTDVAKKGKLTPGSRAALCHAPPVGPGGDAHAAMEDYFSIATPVVRAISPLVKKPRTLLISYPDQGESMATECLEHFQGDTIIHIGELLPGGTGTRSGGHQAPWGKTTNSDFQVELAETFHCVLSYALPCMPFSKDYLTVWVRTKWTAGRSGQEGLVQEEEEEEEEEEEKEKTLEEWEQEEEERVRKEVEKEETIVITPKGKKGAKAAKAAAAEAAAASAPKGKGKSKGGQKDAKKGGKVSLTKALSSRDDSSSDGGSEMDDEDGSGSDFGSQDADRDEWADIPDDECLPKFNVAAPKYAFLLAEAPVKAETGKSSRNNSIDNRTVYTVDNTTNVKAEREERERWEREDRVRRERQNESDRRARQDREERERRDRDRERDERNRRDDEGRSREEGPAARDWSLPEQQREQRYSPPTRSNDDGAMRSSPANFPPEAQAFAQAAAGAGAGAGLRFDPFTGAPIVPVNPTHRFDPFTGEPIPMPRFDPFTGQPIPAAPQPRFDPFTGRAVEAPAAPVQSFDSFTGLPVAAAPQPAPQVFDQFGGPNPFTLNKQPAAAAVSRHPELGNSAGSSSASSGNNKTSAFGSAGWTAPGSGGSGNGNGSYNNGSSSWRGSSHGFSVDLNSSETSKRAGGPAVGERGAAVGASSSGMHGDHNWPRNTKEGLSASTSHNNNNNNYNSSNNNYNNSSNNNTSASAPASSTGKRGPPAVAHVNGKGPDVKKHDKDKAANKGKNNNSSNKGGAPPGLSINTPKVPPPGDPFLAMEDYFR